MIFKQYIKYKFGKNNLSFITKKFIDRLTIFFKFLLFGLNFIILLLYKNLLKKFDI